MIIEFLLCVFVISTVCLVMLYVRAVVLIDKMIARKKHLQSDLNHKRNQYGDLLKHSHQVDKDYGELLEELRETRKQSAMHWGLKK